MKVLSIVGIVLFSLNLIAILFDDTMSVGLEMLEQKALETGSPQLSEIVDSLWGTIGLSMIASVFGLTLSIVGVTVSVKQTKKREKPFSEQLLELDALKRSGALTESEYEAKRRELLNF